MDAERTLPRRTVLGAATLLGIGATASGCALNNPFDSTPTPVEQAVPDLSPDVAVAVQVVAAIRGTQQVLEAAAARYPGSAPALAPLLAMHRAHLDALIAAVPDDVDTAPTSAPTVAPASRTEARRSVGAAETALHDQLIGFAMRAESGLFARLLGSMTAGLSQHLAAYRAAPG